MNDNSDIIDLLCSRKEFIMAVKPDEKTILHEACYIHGGQHVVKLLQIKGIPINHKNADGKTVLHVACEECPYVIPDLLTHPDIDVNAVDGEGNIPLVYLIKTCNFDLVRLLLEDDRSILEPEVVAVTIESLCHFDSVIFGSLACSVKLIPVEEITQNEALQKKIIRRVTRSRPKSAKKLQ